MPIRILFLTSNETVAWGGSEMLWIKLAEHFSKENYPVGICLKKWDEPGEQLKNLFTFTSVYERSFTENNPIKRLKEKINRKINNVDIFFQQFSTAIKNFKPDMVVVSQGGNHDGIRWMEYCLKCKIPYMTISQAASQSNWPNDSRAESIRNVFKGAILNLFVSQANKRLTEIQINEFLSNGAVIANPFNVPFYNDIPYPTQEVGLNLACVARLDFESKGQDLLFETLSDNKWRSRNLKIGLYGNGNSKVAIQRLAKMFNLVNTIQLMGYEDTSKIWEQNHALILPSRYEGLPLALVEAMLCGRFGIVTNVSGNTEVLRDNENGFIAAAPKLEYLDEALERAWQRRGDWESIGHRAKQYIKQIVPEFPVETVAQLIIKNLP